MPRTIYLRHLEASMRYVLLALAALAVALVACGGASQTANCKKFLACEAALGVAPDGGSISSADNATFGPNGTCWVNPALAKECDDTCAKQLKDLESLPGFKAIPACN